MHLYNLQYYYLILILSQLILLQFITANSDKINLLHERYLRIIYNNKVSTFEQLLEKDSSVSMHTRNLLFHAVEIVRVVKGLAPTIINDLFPLKETNNYNLKHKLFLRYLEMRQCVNVSKEFHI